MQRNKQLSERTLFWRIDPETLNNIFSQRVARRGKWKYLRDGTTEMLFDLDKDESEGNDLSSQNPLTVTALRDSVKQWEAELARQPPKFSVK